MEYLTKQANLYNLDIKVIFNTRDRVSHYNIVRRDNKKVLASVYDVNKACWLQRDDKFICGLDENKDVLIIK